MSWCGGKFFFLLQRMFWWLVPGIKMTENPALLRIRRSAGERPGMYRRMICFCCCCWGGGCCGCYCCFWWVGCCCCFMDVFGHFHLTKALFDVFLFSLSVWDSFFSQLNDGKPKLIEIFCGFLFCKYICVLPKWRIYVLIKLELFSNSSSCRCQICLK